MWACDQALTANIVNSYQAAGPLFTQALQTFLAAQCAIAGDHLWPPDATDAVLKDPNYDFIVVGAGSAGSVVANRLSEVPHWKVLLVEAGGNPTLTTEIPQLFYNNMNTNEDWSYKTEPQEGACRGYKNHRCAWPRGKTLGGCSSINGMFYVRANKLDYDEWAAMGNTGWSYEEVFPYFIKSENFTGELNEKRKQYHGNQGYLNVENDPHDHDFEKLLLSGIKDLGVPILDDINGNTQMGAIKAWSTTKDGIRYSTARAFLSPIKDRKNLHVIKNAYATKILFKPHSNKVSGLLINKNGEEITVNVKKEVIVSGGTINTPQLLHLSGIGPLKPLTNLGIEIKADLPVGENLQDHVFVPFFFTSPGDYKINAEIISKAFIQYIMTRKGPLADTSPHRVVSFLNTTDKNAVSPNIQFHHLVFPPGISNLVDIFQKHGLSEEIQEKYRKMNEENYVMIIYSVVLRPRSKGKVIIKSKDPNEHPLIYANYFNEFEDLNILIEGYKQYIRKLGDTKTFKDAGFKPEWLDLDACKDLEKDSDEFLECYSREMTFSLYHPTSTAKMGTDTDRTAVVDSELRVKNIEGLRVIDASIMPNIVRGNTNAPTIMIGERGADLIKKTWLATHNEL